MVTDFKYERTCAQPGCYNKFKTNIQRKKYCSRACERKSHAEKIKKTCANHKCKNTFETSRKNKKYCCKNCNMEVLKRQSKIYEQREHGRDEAINYQRKLNEAILIERMKDRMDCTKYPQCLTIAAKRNSMKVGCSNCDHYRKQNYYFVKPEEKENNISDVDF